MSQRNLLEVDWNKIPAPSDDGAAAHLVGMTIPQISLIATDDSSVTLSALRGRTVVFAYPRTGEPGKIALVDDWDMIPGARGCTPQTCAFRDLFAELKAADRKSTRLNSSHVSISYAVFCLKKKRTATRFSPCSAGDRTRAVRSRRLRRPPSWSSERW